MMVVNHINATTTHEQPPPTSRRRLTSPTPTRPRHPKNVQNTCQKPAIMHKQPTETDKTRRKRILRTSWRHLPSTSSSAAIALAVSRSPSWMARSNLGVRYVSRICHSWMARSNQAQGGKPRKVVSETCREAARAGTDKDASSRNESPESTACGRRAARRSTG